MTATTSTVKTIIVGSSTFYVFKFCICSRLNILILLHRVRAAHCISL